MILVFDTNIFVSAFVFPGSQAENALLKIINGQDVLLISKPIIDEILTVLAGKFSRDREAISQTAIFLADISHQVRPSKKLMVFQDDPDNRILECALAGKAETIVTGDKTMLRLGKYKGVGIISLRQYLNLPDK